MSSKSFTLVEIMVAVFVFSLLVGIASGIFISAIKVQRRSLAAQQLVAQNGYLMEYLSRSLRMAKKTTDTSCLSATGLNFEKTRFGRGIKFLNYKNQCQEFFWDVATNRFKEATGGVERYLTSAAIRISSFSFGSDASWDQGDDDQPRVTYYLKMKSVGQKPELEPEIEVQTTISQRNLDTLQ